VVSFNQQPLFAFSPHADEMELAAEFLAVEADTQFSVGNLPAGLYRRDQLIVTGVPNTHVAGAIIAFGNVPGESKVRDRVVLNHDREPLLSGIERRALGNCPRFENTA